MSAAAPPATEDPVENFDYIDKDDEDEDEEDDFVPGEDDGDDDDDDEDDDDDDDDDEEASSAVVPLLDGLLFYGAKHALHYQGEGFHLTASEPAPWNLLDAKAKPTAESCELIMSGPCDFESAGSKATPRKLKVTFTVLKEPPPELALPATKTNPFITAAKSKAKQQKRYDSNLGPKTASASSSSSSAPSLPPSPVKHNGTDDSNHINDKKKCCAIGIMDMLNDHGNDSKKTPGIFYKVYGSQVDNHSGADLMEFLGGFHPPSLSSSSSSLQEVEEKVGLVCQARLIPSASGAKKAPPVAAAAAVVKDDDDDDVKDDDTDQQVDVNELIALHEDAGISMDDLKKRYHNDADADADNDNDKNGKRRKTQDEDEDEDSCYGF